MKVPFSEIFHLERFSSEGQRFIKVSEHVVPTKRRLLGTINKKVNAIRRPGIREFVYFSPETTVERIEPHNLSHRN